jgi:hypothetical protein
LILRLDFLELKRLRKKLLMDNLSRKNASKHPKLPKTNIYFKSIRPKSQKKYPYSPKTPNLHKRQNLIKLLNLTKVNDYALGKEHSQLCIHWKISIFKRV